MAQKTAMNLPLQLDRGAAAPLQDQLFEQLRQLILTGKLKPNTRVIATRFLAEQVGVSRRTVLFAYERLIAEGYLETRPAIGTFVCARPPRQSKPETAGISPSEIPRQSSMHPASFRTPPAPRPKFAGITVDFSSSLVDASHLLPPKVWLQGMRNVFAEDSGGLAKPQPAAGVAALRQVIVDYLAATRGLAASPEQVVIVTGRRHACSLVAHLFQRRGDRVVVESPGDETVADFFKTRHAEVIGVAVDEHGLDTDALPAAPVSLAYVTPARQNPLGGTMPASSRMALIEWARASGAYLIEDDSDSEFRYHGMTQQPLAALDPYGLVFYAGSFAKTLGAGLGLGYLVVPGEFAEAIVTIKAMAEDGCRWLEQMVVSNLLSSGEYDHHLRRVRKIYLERRDCLIQALESHFGQVHLVGTEIGTQLTWLMPDHFPPADALREAARARGVNIEGVGGRYRDAALIFGYAALAPEKLRQGIAALADAVVDASSPVSARYDRT